MPRSLRAIALPLVATAALSVCGCGAAAGSGAGSPRPASAVVINTVVIGFTRDPDELPFNPRAARLQEATQQLTAIAGHPVTFQFDIALLPQWQSSFESALIDAIETVARDLTWLHDNDAAEFAYGGPLFKRVECSYVAVPARDSDTFDADAGTLRIHVPSEAGAFIPRDAVLVELRDAYWRGLDRRFAKVEPEQADDVALYYRWITSDRNSGGYVDLGTPEGSPRLRAPRRSRASRASSHAYRLGRSRSPRTWRRRSGSPSRSTTSPTLMRSTRRSCARRLPARRSIAPRRRG